MLPTETVYFVHISDTHFGPTPDYERYGHKALPCAEALVTRINQLPYKPDFVVHTGDVATDPQPEAYELAAETFSRLEYPIYYVTGNHDRARDLHRYMTFGPKTDLIDDKEILTYTFDKKGYRFLVIDARAPDELDPHGLLSERQLEVVRQEVSVEGPPLVVFLHFPIWPLNSPWMDAYMLIVNGEALHRALLPARSRLRGVFHGHVHQHMQTVRDGILYVSTASAFSQFTAWPTDLDVGKDSQHPPGFSFVHLMPRQTIIHQHVFPRPSS